MPSPSELPVHPFSLRDVVSDVCDSHREADPALLVEPVLEAIDFNDYQEALRQALHGYIVTHVVSSRQTPRSALTETEYGTSRKVGTSRLAGIAALLNVREYSPVRGAWIHFSETTAEDALAMAAKREKTAIQYHAKAGWYASVAEALNASGVATVADLPAMVQQRLLETRPA